MAVVQRAASMRKDSLKALSRFGLVVSAISLQFGELKCITCAQFSGGC